MLLTTEIDVEGITPLLESLGIQSTLESAVNMAMIKEAMAGNVKAYNAIKDVIGQTAKTDQDLKQQELDIEKQRIELERQRADLEKQRLEIERLRKTVNPMEDAAEDDGFIDALRGEVKDTFAGAGAFVEE